MPRLFIVTGELSGDLHAAGLVRSLRRVSPGTEIGAVGGPNLESAGVPLIASIRDLSVVGLLEVVKKYPVIIGIFRAVVRHIRRTRPDVLLLVDFPGFNLPLAREVRRYCGRIVFYVSPQIWAWKYGRIRTIRRYADEMIVLLPFEEKLYRDEGVPVRYFGHPLAERARAVRPAGRKPGSGRKVLLFLPGSRRNEVRSLLPVMRAVMEELGRRHPELDFEVSSAPGLPSGLVGGFLEGCPRTRIVGGGDYARVASADAVVAASGTATLEVSLLGRPMCVLYRLHWLSYHLLRMMVKVRFVSLPNILLGRGLVREFVSWKLDPRSVVREAEAILYDRKRRSDMTAGMRRIMGMLYRKDSYGLAAGRIAAALGAAAVGQKNGKNGDRGIIL
jgi:lipid-A-disaccharide synthase